MGCCTMKGVTERCIVRLHLTSLGRIERKILLLEHVNSFASKRFSQKLWLVSIINIIIALQ